MCDDVFIRTAKCHFCPECRGTGCIAELPGMGGIRNNINFQLNCSDWDIYPRGSVDEADLFSLSLPTIRLAPITGGVENVGYPDEKEFYYSIIRACVKANLPLSIGDGCPDIKLLSGVKAVQSVGSKSAVFIKPYENKKIFERAEWASSVAESFGVDIDAYNIITMRNKVKLECKSVSLMKELSSYIKKSYNVPFAIKGVFTHKDLELVKEVKPDIVVISNHGGRVENRTGSTVDFLAEHAEELKKNCGEIWVDGGIRRKRDLYVASYYGAKQVMIGRPLIAALCKKGENGILEYLKETFDWRI